MAGEHAGHRQRMRERFLAGGLEGFADHEVLELMLFYAIPQRNVNPLAHRLLDRFGTLHAVLEAPVEELMKVEGVGQYAALLSSLGVAMADHIIVSGREALSMAGCGLITRERREDRLLTRVANSDGETLIRAELMKKRKEKQT